MPTSPSQIKANRENALKSTGPKTSEGKARSSRNAIKHGLCASTAVVPGESAEEFAALRDQLWASLAPANALEDVLVERVVNSFWGLRRAGRIFNELLDRVAQARRNRHFIDSRGSTLPLDNELGWAFEAVNGTALDRVARHDVRYERSAMRALQALQQLRTSEVVLAIDAPVQLGLFDNVDEPATVGDVETRGTFISSISDLANLPRVGGMKKNG